MVSAWADERRSRRDAVLRFLSKQVFVGFVGYGYQQITDDFGQNPQLDGFLSRVFGIGPQFGYLFPVGDMQGYVNLKGYGESLPRIGRRGGIPG